MLPIELRTKTYREQLAESPYCSPGWTLPFSRRLLSFPDLAEVTKVFSDIFFNRTLEGVILLSNPNPARWAYSDGVPYSYR